MLQARSWLSSSPSRAAGCIRLRVSAAHSEWNHVGIALVAMEEGYFADEGLTDVELIAFEESSGELLDREAVQIDLLAEGIVDIAIDPRTTFVLEARDQRKPVWIVAARRKSHAFILLGSKGLKSIYDLRGKTIDMGHPGGATDVMMRQLLKDHALDAERDVFISYSGAPMHDEAGRAKAFRGGLCGPAILLSSGHAQPLMNDGYPILIDLRRPYPSRHDRVTAANEDFCREHPDMLKAFLKGMIRGCRYVLERRNRAAFMKIITEAGFLATEHEKSSFEGLFTSWQERVTPDLSLPLEGIQRIVDEVKTAAKISSSFQIEEVLRLEALELAQRELTRPGES